jgi:hypothetical protein
MKITVKGWVPQRTPVQEVLDLCDKHIREQVIWHTRSTLRQMTGCKGKRVRITIEARVEEMP